MKRILIVEDDRAIAELERDYLEANDYEVEICEDGESGLKRALQEDFALILLDVMLPKEDGFQVCRNLRASKNVPIILVSAKREDMDKIRGLGLGANDYIVKPFNPSELIARVKSLPIPYTSIGSVRKSKRTVPIRNLSKPYGEAAIVSANIKRTRTNYQIEASYAEKNRDIQSYCTHNRRIPFFLQSNMTDISVYIPPFHNTSYFVCQFICFYLQIHFPS